MSSNLNIQNPKFSFTEDQTKQVLMAAYHLSQASEYIQETNDNRRRNTF